MKPTDYYKDLRADLHRNPGVSGQESYAHDLIVRELHTLNPDELYDHVGGYGVIALWRSSQPLNARTLAFRADIDALPSGHRCGHDGHTAIMLRFARIVSETKERKYNIVLLFQPEEETGEGARKIMKSGILQRLGVDAIFGLHNLPGSPKGSVTLIRNTFSAASCGVIYKFIGRQTHASTPEMGLNPGLAVAETIQRINELSVISASHFCFSTLICCRVGEEAFGTSAGNGEVMFTMRASDNDAFTNLTQTADKIAIEVAKKYGLVMEKQVREPFRALENTPRLVDQLKSCFDNELGVRELAVPFRWSEDFAEYLTEFQGAFFGLGSGEQQPELHNPTYDFPDDIIEIGAHCFELIMKLI